MKTLHTKVLPCVEVNVFSFGCSLFQLLHAPWLTIWCFDSSEVHICSGSTQNERSTDQLLVCSVSSAILDAGIRHIEDRAWQAVHGVKAFLILVSVLLYCCGAKCYRYRLRDEVVNERYLVEEVYDREPKPCGGV